MLNYDSIARSLKHPIANLAMLFEIPLAQNMVEYDLKQTSS